MSVHVSSWAWKQKLGDPGLKLVLVKLAENADDDGYSWWRQKRLADECEMSRATVQRKLKTLVERGYLHVEPSTGTNGARVSNYYRILHPLPQSEAAPPPHSREAAPASPVRHQEPSVEPSVVSSSLLRRESPPAEPESSHREVVEAAWLAAPGTIQHRHAYFTDEKIRRKIDRAVSKYGVEDVVAAVDAYAEVVESPDFWWSYRWTLGDFLGRGLDKFVPEAQPRDVFVHHENAFATNGVKKQRLSESYDRDDD